MKEEIEAASAARIGIDLGSVSTKVSVVQDGRIASSWYLRHNGRPLAALSEIVRADCDSGAWWRGRKCSVTGSASGLLASALGIEPVNEIVALSAAVSMMLPSVRSVIEMGGQDAKLLLFRDSPDGPVFDDFSMNSICAAGTGAFLDQQAQRLGMETEDLGDAALRCTSPPRIAGRCSVFAKSDMIHLQQTGAPVEDVVAGLCFAVARNFKSTIASGKEFRAPVAFVGGVAANAGMVRAFQDVLAEDGTEILIPEHFDCLVAAGAAISHDPRSRCVLDAGFTSLLSEIPARVEGGPPVSALPALSLACPASPALECSTAACPGAEPPEEEGVFLGIDVGSISTNLAAIGAGGRLLSRQYLRTSGRPIEAVKTGLRLVESDLGPNPRVLGVCTTGSGRYMTGDFVGADVVSNEITAQARAAVEADPDVDTVFEIGGQDSKFISIEKGRVVDFEMNKVCAAGTGSFLEEQAERLGVEIEDFGSVALAAASPTHLGERCTVFMETDVVLHMARGESVDNIIAGLCYSIARNYLGRVVGKRKTGNRILFQGGTAWNEGVRAAFESILGRPVAVPPNHDVTGAIGAALLSRDRCVGRPSSFRGFSLSESGYSLSTFVCRSCSNMCEIHRVDLDDGRSLFYGSRCEKYERTASTGDSRMAVEQRGTDYFPVFEELLLSAFRDARAEGVIPAGADAPPLGLTIGIPRALWFWELLPFFETLLRLIGAGVRLSGTTSSKLVHDGVESVAAETCFPVKIAHGHVMDLMRGGEVDHILLPSILRSPPHRGATESYNCPYVQASPYMIEAALQSDALQTSAPAVSILRPVVDFTLPVSERFSSLIAMAVELGADAKTAARAARIAFEAQRSYTMRVARTGRDILSSLASDPGHPNLVLVSRPYNGCDPGVNVDLARKLSRLGANVIPLGFLDIPCEKAALEHGNMYWHYGLRILAGALAIAGDERLHAVYLTNFGCGPDSFIHQFFQSSMGEKPFLTIEIDEHAADAGVITRCEAFLDSIRGRAASGSASPGAGSRATGGRSAPDSLEGRRIWVPQLGEGSRLVAACARRYGLDVEVMPPTTSATVALGRSVTTGKECYPAIITSGNMLSILRQNPPSSCAFFMGTASGPCRFGQYCHLHRLILDRAGYADVPIITASSANSYGSVSCLSTPRFQLDLLRSAAIADVLMRALLRTRPYELEKGRASEAYENSLDEMSEALGTGRGVRAALSRAGGRFLAIDTVDTRRPRILLFGEIYVRNDPYANARTIDRIEALGGEVIFTPVCEWFDFVNHSFMMRSLARRKPLAVAGSALKHLLMKQVRRSVERPFRGLLADRREPDAARILEAAAPYMTENVGGEAILCIGAPLALLGEIDGAVNVFPFTCLPGTIVTAISKRLRRDHPGLPWLNLAFDGQEDTDTDTRLQAFMYQVRQSIPDEIAGEQARSRLRLESEVAGREGRRDDERVRIR
ncbi:hypothetical protein JW921_02030 [Candidatus Fermentibacterales bacterium]|nr:hypothetical protein [Candidatus Fermentibacterales bacterium]